MDDSESASFTSFAICLIWMISTIWKRIKIFSIYLQKRPIISVIIKLESLVKVFDSPTH